MLRLLKFLLTGDWHLHRWKTIDEAEASDECGQSWTRYYCKCEICGKHKKFD